MQKVRVRAEFCKMFMWIEYLERRLNTSEKVCSFTNERSFLETEIRTWSNLKMNEGMNWSEVALA
jgi:hypothetical protein